MQLSICLNFIFKFALPHMGLNAKTPNVIRGSEKIETRHAVSLQKNQNQDLQDYSIFKIF